MLPGPKFLFRSQFGFLQPQGVMPFRLLQFGYRIAKTASMAVRYVHLREHFLLLLLQMKAQKRLDLEWICLKVSWRWFATSQLIRDSNRQINFLFGQTEKGRTGSKSGDTFIVFCIFLINSVCSTQLSWYVQDNTMSSCISQIRKVAMPARKESNQNGHLN